MSDSNAHDARPLSEHKTTQPSPVKAVKKRNYRPYILATGAVLCGLIGFGAGVSYQKDRTALNAKTTAGSGSMMSSGGVGFRQGRRGFYYGTFGSVTAVSGTSITVNDTRSNKSTTFAINSSTTVTNNGVSATVADIKTGDRVRVQPSASSSTTAAMIVINPSPAGGGYHMMGNPGAAYPQ